MRLCEQCERTSALDGSVDCASQQVELSFLGGSIVDYAAAWRSDVVAVITCYFTFVRFDFHFHLIRSFTYLDQFLQNPFGTGWRETGRTCIFPTVFSHHWIGIIYWKRSLSFTLWQIYWNKCADTIILCSSATANTVWLTLSSTFHPVLSLSPYLPLSLGYFPISQLPASGGICVCI